MPWLLKQGAFTLQPSGAQPDRQARVVETQPAIPSPVPDSPDLEATYGIETHIDRGPSELKAPCPVGSFCPFVTIDLQLDGESVGYSVNDAVAAPEGGSTVVFSIQRPRANATPVEVQAAAALMNAPELPSDVFGTGLPKVQRATTVEDAETVLRARAQAVGVDIVLQRVGSAEGESIEVSTVSATEPPSYVEAVTDWIIRRGEVSWVAHGGDGINIVQTDELVLPASALERDGKWFVSFDGRTLYGGGSMITARLWPRSDGRPCRAANGCCTSTIKSSSRRS